MRRKEIQNDTKWRERCVIGRKTRRNSWWIAGWCCHLLISVGVKTSSALSLPSKQQSQGVCEVWIETESEDTIICSQTTVKMN